jgi:hypothetical protein
VRGRVVDSKPMLLDLFVCAYVFVCALQSSGVQLHASEAKVADLERSLASLRQRHEDALALHTEQEGYLAVRV